MTDTTLSSDIVIEKSYLSPAVRYWENGSFALICQFSFKLHLSFGWNGAWEPIKLAMPFTIRDKTWWCVSLTYSRPMKPQLYCFLPNNLKLLGRKSIFDDKSFFKKLSNYSLICFFFHLFVSIVCIVLYSHVSPSAFFTISRCVLCSFVSC